MDVSRCAAAVFLAVFCIGNGVTAGQEDGATRILSMDGHEVAEELLSAAGAGAGRTVILSPAGVFAALAVVAAASGAEMSDAGRLLVGRNVTDNDDVVRSATGLWVRDGTPLVDGFAETVMEMHGAPVTSMPFDSAFVQAVNVWAAENTGGAIETLIDSPPDGALLIASALAFKGLWEHAFDPESTVDAPFTLTSGDSVEVAMMHGTARAYGLDGSAVVVVRLPLEHPGYVVDLLSPGADPSALFAMPGPIETEPVTIVVPKFDIAGEINLLETLGATRFDAIIRHPLKAALVEPESVGAATQRVRVAIDENGVKAAVATVVSTIRSSHPAPEIRFASPFYFAIRDLGSDVPLFAGYIADPRG